MVKKNWRESDIIELFNNGSPPAEGLIKGIGDDCAVIRPLDKHDLIVTTDMLVEGVHFNSTSHPAFSLGRKAMAVNISDVAAMGGIPQFAFLGIAIPNDFTEEWLIAFRDGIQNILSEFAVVLAGGDTVRGAHLTISVTLFGSVPSNSAVLRNGAVVGDSVYVSGHLGSAAAGLIMFQTPGLRSLLDEPIAAPFIRQHLDPRPDVTCGSLLARSGYVTAMQDISDGIATDLAHICMQSQVGAEIDSLKLPGHHDLETLSGMLGCDPLSLKISGGEDYHLVFTVKAGKEEALERYLAGKTDQPIYRIGKVISGSGVALRVEREKRDITFQGYRHGGGHDG